MSSEKVEHVNDKLGTGQIELEANGEVLIYPPKTGRTTSEKIVLATFVFLVTLCALFLGLYLRELFHRNKEKPRPDCQTKDCIDSASGIGRYHSVLL